MNSCGLFVLITVVIIGASLLVGPTYRLGRQGRKYKKIGELITDVSRLTGLDGERSEESAWFPQIQNLRFEGALASGRRGRVSFFTESAGSNHWTCVRIGVDADDAASLTITRETLGDKLWKWLGWTTELEIGDPTFDSRFLIQPEKGSDTKAKSALDRGLKTIVSECFERHSAQKLVLEKGELLVAIEIDAIAPAAYRDVLALLDRAAAFFDRVQIRVRGLEGTKRAFKSATGELRCAYCHGGIRGDEPDLVACPRCATALHDHCWAEHGRCPVLGCPAVEPERARSL
jgi:hypothetical protein